ncbi:ROK family protein [Kribbella sindirgiensis]|uniref:ROK family protein n=1 Tax=Kribbella sindirgiensis TaxID=1124744 RepID=A0A4R0ILZ9_9ACTN|nr:ROK family protein [Kribbella sindirgiensis]TCC32228.1 ROK family protein [Kribbella sindirgiensis]
MILVADIGGTKIAATRVAKDGTLAADVRQSPTPAGQGAPGVVEATCSLLASLQDREDIAVAISTAGVVDTANGTVLAATNSIPGWGGTRLATLLSGKLGLPTWVLGDGNAFGIGLALEFGAANLLALIAGTGVGGSLVLAGEPVLGSHHVGGHLGHIVAPEAVGMPCPCGRTGHLEAVASGHGILAWYHSRGGDPAVSTTRELTNRPADALAHAALVAGGTALGAAAGGLVNAIDPALVVVAGSVARAGEPWESALRTAYQETLIPSVSATRLEISAAGAETALRGAAHYAMRRMSA